MSKTYRHKTTGAIVTETWLKEGMGASDEFISEYYLPIEYAYPFFDEWRQHIAPDGEPELNAAGDAFVQKFKVMPLDEEGLAASFGRYKEQALERLNAAWQEAEQSGRLNSTVGFPIDATVRADRDIRGLITKLEATGEEQTMFCDADNNMQPVNLEKLKVMQLEVIQYGQELYAKKWAKREAIMAAADFEEVDAVSLSFMDAA